MDVFSNIFNLTKSVLNNFSFFKTKKNKRFEYKPLFYDEEKERLKKSKDDVSRKREEFQHQLRTNWTSQRKKSSQGQNKRVFMIVILLVLIIYLLNDSLGTLILKIIEK